MYFVCCIDQPAWWSSLLLLLLLLLPCGPPLPCRLTRCASAFAEAHVAEVLAAAKVNCQQPWLPKQKIDVLAEQGFFVLQHTSITAL